MPPPTPPPPPVSGVIPRPAAPNAPTVPPKGPEGAFLVELLVYNGSPFKDHWAYFVRSNTAPSKGVVLHATGDVRNGFKFEIKRAYDLDETNRKPDRIPLQWVDARYFDERAMFNNGVAMLDTVPVCRFEASAHKVKAPGKSLNSTDKKAAPGRRLVQRDCQTWIVESADQLVAEGIFNTEIATYLHEIQQ